MKSAAPVVVVHDLEREDRIRILAGQLKALQPDRCQALLLHTTLAVLPSTDMQGKGSAEAGPFPNNFLSTAGRSLALITVTRRTFGGLSTCARERPQHRQRKHPRCREMATSPSKEVKAPQRPGRRDQTFFWYGVFCSSHTSSAFLAFSSSRSCWRFRSNSLAAFDWPENQPMVRVRRGLVAWWWGCL